MPTQLHPGSSGARPACVVFHSTSPVPALKGKPWRRPSALDSHHAGAGVGGRPEVAEVHIVLGPGAVVGSGGAYRSLQATEADLVTVGALPAFGTNISVSSTTPTFLKTPRKGNEDRDPSINRPRLIEWTQLHAMHAAACSRVLLPPDAQLPCQCRTFEQMAWCHRTHIRTATKTMQAQEKGPHRRGANADVDIGASAVEVADAEGQGQHVREVTGIALEGDCAIGLDGRAAGSAPRGPVCNAGWCAAHELLQSVRSFEILVVSQGQVENRKQPNSPWR